MAQDTYVNGTRYSWPNFSCIATAINNGSNATNGGNYTPPKGAMQSFNYSAKQEGADVDGNMVGPVGVTDGYGRGTLDWEILKSESDDFDAGISGGPGGTPLMSCFFQWTISYSINDIDTTTVIFQGVKISGVDENGQKGTDAATVKYSARCSRIIKNGIVLFGDPVTP